MTNTNNVHKIIIIGASDFDPADCNNDCGIAAKNAAQNILDHNSITLSTSHPGSSDNDGADAYSNINHMAQGCPAMRSS